MFKINIYFCCVNIYTNRKRCSFCYNNTYDLDDLELFSILSPVYSWQMKTINFSLVRLGASRHFVMAVGTNLLTQKKIIMSRNTKSSIGLLPNDLIHHYTDSELNEVTITIELRHSHEEAATIKVLHINVY